MVRRVEAAQDRERVAAARAVAARQGRGNGVGRRWGHPQTAAGTTSTGSDGSTGVATSRSATTTAKPGRRIEAPAQPGLGEERVEHRPARPALRQLAWPVMAGSRVMSNAAFCCEYQSGNAELSRAARCSASGSRVSSSFTRNR